MEKPDMGIALHNFGIELKHNTRCAAERRGRVVCTSVFSISGKRKDISLARLCMRGASYVWTALAVQDECDYRRSVRVQPF
jgi:hypothetical protein